MGIVRCKNVKAFWDARAKEHTKQKEVTHRDIWQRWLEIEQIKHFLRPKDRVLDVGCGNGYTTGEICRCVREVVGIDYSRQMILRADRELRGKARKNVRFAVRDVLDLAPEDFGRFDAAITERCLINLPSWKEQQRALANIAAVLKPGGRLIFVEGGRSGRDHLNRLRKRVGLSAMPIVWHNRDFEEQRLLRSVTRHFLVEERLSFGVYDFISRVVYPLVVHPREPEYDSPFNQIAATVALQYSALDPISRIIFLVLKKKAHI